MPGAPICVGRESELATLLDSYDRTREGGSLLTLVHGDAGAGKSRVLSELGRRLRLEGCPVLEGRAEPGRPFGAFASIVERALRFLTDVGAAPQVDLSDLACREGCHPFWYQHEGALDGAAEGLPTDGGRFGPAKVMERRMRFFDAIAALLHEVSDVRAPLVLLHDLDRADAGTSRLLAHLLDGAGWGQPLGDSSRPRPGALFVASCRSILTDETAAWSELLSHPSGGTLELGPLDAEGVRAYLQSPEAIAQVLERTDGVPERLDLLLQARPLTPEESLGRRLAELPASARGLLEALAVLGHSGDLDTLARVSEQRPDAAAMSALRGSPLVLTEVLDGRILLSFARDNERERAYGLIDAERRRGLHSRFADHFAGSLDVERGVAGAFDQRAHCEQAARHALLAGNVERALPLTIVAARSLAARHAHGEAAALLEELPSDLLADSDEDLLAELAELHRMAGDYPRALEHAKALRAREPDSSSAARRLGDLLTQAGQLAEATRSLEEARRLAARADDAREGAQAEALLAELHYQRAAYDEGVICAQAALQAAGEDLALAVHARNTLGKVALARRDASAAAEYFEQNRAVAQAHGLEHAEAQALTNLGVAMLRRQDFEGARETFEDAIRVAAQAGDTRDHAIATENLAVLAHLRRDATAALHHYHEAITQLKRLGNRGMLARVANNLGELYLSLGDRTRARSLCDFATHMGGIHLSPTVRAEGLLLRGRVDLAEHELTEARGAFEAALSTFEAIGEERRVDAALALIRVCLAEGRVSDAEARVAALAHEELTPKRRAELALIGAELDRAAGRPPLSAARRACTLAEAARDPQRLLPALLHRCRAHLDEGDVGAAARDLDRAYEVDDELTALVPEVAQSAWAQRPVRELLAELDARLESGRNPEGMHPSRRPSRPPTQGAGDAEGRRLRQLFPDLVGSSSCMVHVSSMLEKVAPTDAMVLIRGESGTGKELVAEALHRHSSRRTRPMVKVNCAALVETLLLSELFGHERGAFTGATSRKKGRFELADGGTIFLDEIGDISPKTQVALLRVLQERRFERVGGTQAVEVDVRIVTATHRDLEAMVREGSFREDLYYRLRGVMIEVPPLRQRLDDLAELSEHLLARIARERGDSPKRLSADSVRLLATHAWPGNVRELENVLRSATLFSDAPTLQPAHLEAFASTFTPAFTEAAPSAPPAALEELLYTRVRGGELSLLEMKKTLERDCIVRAIAETDGNITRAAGLLGMKRPRLSQLVKQYGLLEGSSKRTS
ncbi:MAG: AAA family ATPase [Deltaproteobacteria bacterium]|nr:AAA family ATPase [Deltaproteobacteria bacterium]